MRPAGTRSPIDSGRTSAAASCSTDSAEHWQASALQAVAAYTSTGASSRRRREPGDFDACGEIAGVESAVLDPVLLEFANARAARKQRFRGELFPAEAAADPDGTRFVDYFQRDKTHWRAEGHRRT